MSTPNEFKIGDRVAVKDNCLIPAWRGLLGTVVQVREGMVTGIGMMPVIDIRCDDLDYEIALFTDDVTRG